MTDEEARTLIATRIMGWHLNNDTYGPDWHDYRGEYRSSDEIWTPDKSIKQALDVVEALRQKGWQVRITQWPDSICAVGRNIEEIVHMECRWWGETLDPDPPLAHHLNTFYSQAETLPLAVFRVAAQIAEAMEDKKE
jgi:hypothetical protein